VQSLDEVNVENHDSIGIDGNDDEETPQRVIAFVTLQLKLLLPGEKYIQPILYAGHSRWFLYPLTVSCASATAV